MKKKLSPAFVAAGTVVALSLFVILSMLFYTPTDHLQRAGELAKQDNFRFHVAHLFFGTFGVGAYIGWTVILAWAVVVFFRESAGELLLRGVSLGVAVLSGAALADMLGPNNLGGDLGFAVASVLKGGLGATVGSILLSGLFLASLAFATEFGFLNHIRSAHRLLTETREEAAPPAPDIVSGINEGAAELLLVDEPEASAETSGLEAPVPAPDHGAADEDEETGEPEERRVIVSAPLRIETEQLADDLLLPSAGERSASPAERILVRAEETLSADVELALHDPAEDEPDGEETAIFAAAPAAPAPEPMPEPRAGILRDETFDLEEHELEPPAAEEEPEPAGRWRPALESVFEALVGPAAAPVAPPPAPATETAVLDDPVFLLDDEITIVSDEPFAAEPAPSPEADAVREEPEPVVLAEPEPVVLAEPEPVVTAGPEIAEEVPAAFAVEAALPVLAEEVPLREEDDGREPLLLFMQDLSGPVAPPVADPPAGAAPAPEEPPPAPPAPEPEQEPEIPVLVDLAPPPPAPRPLFRRRKPEPAPAEAPRDPLLGEAAEIFLERGRASVVLLQRRLDVGYTRASRIIEALAGQGLVGPLTESGSREVLLSREEWAARRAS